MELPARLREAVDRLLDDTPLNTLKQASRLLTERYRAELRDSRLHLNDDIAVKAYLAARLPATYAAVRASLEAVSKAAPNFTPKTLLDVGAGPGTVLWASETCWSGIETATLLEASTAARAIGSGLADTLPLQARWIDADITKTLPALPAADLVTLAYVLDEIAPAQRPVLVDTLWQLTAGMLVIVEPGTPAGWRRILEARSRLIAQGAHIVAPCPHDLSCPLVAPDWCHFSRRVARSKTHRLVKEAEVPWEDEKFIYLAAARDMPAARPSRVIAPVKASSGKVTLTLCRPDGTRAEQTFSKRDGDTYKRARRADWGDTLDAD